MRNINQSQPKRMALLDSYFHSLRELTGAEVMVIMRDDAAFGSSSSLSDAKSTRSTSSPKNRVKFENECEEAAPPCLPRRVVSRDDLHVGSKRIRNPDDSSSRFQSLFGADIASLMASKQKNSPEARKCELKSLSKLDAPKFPIRRGSKDDLSTLLSARRSTHSPASRSWNEKVDLNIIIDDVMKAIGGAKK